MILQANVNDKTQEGLDTLNQQIHKPLHAKTPHHSHSLILFFKFKLKESKIEGGKKASNLIQESSSVY